MIDPNMEVILVDDDEIVLLLNKVMLRKANFHPSPKLFTKAQDCLKYLLNDTNMNPCLLFLDINMPEMNGWEFLDEVATKEFNIKIMIVIVSSSIDRSDHERAESNPFVIDYIEKPIYKNRLIELKSHPSLVSYF